jgi:hypothetical protein
MINDIERFDFWNREADEFLRRENIKKNEKVMRWDSVTNKVPFKLTVDVAKEEAILNEYPTA